MPILVRDNKAAEVLSVIPASPGYRIEASMPADMDQRGVAVPTDVVGWAQIADPEAPGGCRVEPVFLANGRAWTPDQYWAKYGPQITLKVTRL